MLLSYSAGSYVDLNFYNKTDTDNLLANKVSNIGDVSLSGNLDLGTTYANSRIRCHADESGYTGYVELNAYNSYDIYLNLSTTRTDGGWMYFAINNDNYMQLSGSENKVHMYNKLDVNVNNSASSIKAYNTTTGYTSYKQLEAKWNSQGYVNFESDRPGAHYLCLTVKDDLHMYCGDNKVHTYKDTSIAGNLDVSKVLNLQRNPAVSDTPPLIITNSSSSGWFLSKFESTLNNIGCLFEYKTSASSTSWWKGVWGWDE